MVTEQLLVKRNVINDNREALAPDAHAKTGAVHVESEGTHIVSVAVRQHEYLIAYALVFAPRMHHKKIINGRECNGVDTARQHLIGIIYESG